MPIKFKPRVTQTQTQDETRMTQQEFAAYREATMKKLMRFSEIKENALRKSDAIQNAPDTPIAPKTLRMIAIEKEQRPPPDKMEIWKKHGTGSYKVINRGLYEKISPDTIRSSEDTLTTKEEFYALNEAYIKKKEIAKDTLKGAGNLVKKSRYIDARVQ